MFDIKGEPGQRICDPCPESAVELQRDGYSLGGVFVGEQYFQQDKEADFPSAEVKTKASLERYKKLRAELDRRFKHER